MAVSQAFRCDFCDRVIEDSKGFAVIGNIHILEENETSHPCGPGIGGGIVGNNLEPGSEGSSIVSRVAHYHNHCLVSKLTDGCKVYRKSIVP